jgi:hypothetical protein
MFLPIKNGDGGKSYEIQTDFHEMKLVLHIQPSICACNRMGVTWIYEIQHVRALWVKMNVSPKLKKLKNEE